MSEKRKLIEVALPLEAINRVAAREKSIRHGHPSTFHLWWARRPLAACRAVLFGSLVDDPSSDPQRFPSEEDQERERNRLFAILEEFVKWENTTNPTVVDAARKAVLDSGGDLAGILDPFCGGGSIPLEAQRLGLRVYASDLNPVAALITRALVEIPPRFSGRDPVNPERLHAGLTTWSGVAGMVEDVRYYAKWMATRAQASVGDLYPEIRLPRDQGGSPAKVIAWIWARTVRCPNPACGATAPLLNSFAMSSRKGRLAWVKPVANRAAKEVRFEVHLGAASPAGGSVSRTGAVCLVCQTAMPLPYVREEGKAGRMGAQLVCIVADGPRGRVYLEADPAHIAAADVNPPDAILETDLPHNPRAVTTTNYGIKKHRDLFTPRQLTTLQTFTNLVGEARQQALHDGASEDYAGAIATYLGLCVSRLANRTSSQSFWDTGGENVQQVFARNALPMIWVYAEGNPFSESSGNFLGQVEYLAEALARVPSSGNAIVTQLDATAQVDWPAAVVCTDPPYYDNVPYADLSDFFYVWLRLSLRNIHPDLFGTVLVPKAQELIAEPARQGSWEAAASFFEAGLRKSFASLREAQRPGYPMTVFYAFKQSEADSDGAGHVSTGWETMLQGLLDAGFAITGTWPVRTEQPGGLREVGRGALASSIVLVCRRRPAEAPLATRRQFLNELKRELPAALHALQQGNIAPVDLAQASIGPGMAVFSRYSKVVEADGSTMRVRAALGLINQALDEALMEQEGDFDPDTRWAVAWFEQNAYNSGPFGVAETLSKAKNTAINGLVNAGIVEARGNKVRLIARDELDGKWDPRRDRRLTIWEVTQHLIRALEISGETGAAELLRSVGGIGETARELAYRLYNTCERRKWSREAQPYNALVVAWPEIQRLTAEAPTGQQSLEI